MGKRDNNGECNKIRRYLLYWLRLDSGGRLRPYGNIRFYIRHALNSRIERESIELILKEVVNEKNLKTPITFLAQNGTNFDERFGSAVSAAFCFGVGKINSFG